MVPDVPPGGTAIVGSCHGAVAIPADEVAAFYRGYRAFIAVAALACLALGGLWLLEAWLR